MDRAGIRNIIRPPIIVTLDWVEITRFLGGGKGFTHCIGIRTGLGKEEGTFEI